MEAAGGGASGGGGAGSRSGVTGSGSGTSLNAGFCVFTDSNSSLGGGDGSSDNQSYSIPDHQAFHHRCGRRITLSNGNRTATRSVRDFSHALVFSAEPLLDDVLFEVVIERKNHSWGGSIEIGVTSEPPEKLELPSCALAMRNGTWVMSGTDVRKDGICLNQLYGVDLESLNENDRVGVMRTSNDDLEFFVNGITQGVAAFNMPKVLWALVDLYGRCVQVSITGGSETDTRSSEYDPYTHSQPMFQNLELPMSVDLNITDSLASTLAGLHVETLPIYTNSNSLSPILSSVRSTLTSNTGDYEDPSDRMRFHTRCGSLVKLSPNYRSAERRRPLDEFNNGVVMTHRPLKDNELFEIRIDKLVDKWSGSIEVGVTTHNPAVLHFPATMTNMRSGTIMMSGCGILTNGKGTRRQYGEFNLDELREGDRVGMMRHGNGNLHYYINGQDQGVAATRVSAVLWGVIDLYGMTIKVTIVDRDEREQQNLVTRRNNLMSNAGSLLSSANINLNSMLNAVSVMTSMANGTLGTPPPALSLLSPDSECNIAASNAAMSNMTESMNVAGSSNVHRNEDRLTFHPKCGSHATVTHSGRTALRPNASDDFNNGVVLTRRPLRPNELFQVRLERVVPKWAGSVEMGVTTYSADELDFPFTMTNVRSGTWMMTGNGVMHNGITVFEQYGQNLDRLQVGDRVGVVRKDDGTLHFWVNGVDQGPAASNVPDRVYGVIDLYGQAAQASIVDTSECGSPDTGNSTISNTTLYSETPLRFHSVHGKNVGITNGGLTASRPNSLAEFNDAIVFSNRPLRQRELFEIVIETIVTHWSGNIEIGVTSVRPDEIKLAPNATDLDAQDTIVLCGPMIFHNRKTLRTNIVFDLDTLGSGARVGVMRNMDFIHFFVNGVDQGPACECRWPNIYAVVDLYGQCAQVSLTQNQPDIRAPYATSENSQSCQATSVIQPGSLENKHRWTCISGNVSLTQNWTMASRFSGSAAALSRCVVFSEHPLTVGSPFEIKIVSYNPLFAGCLNIGVTDLNLADDNVRKNIPLSIKRIPANVWYLSGNEVRENQTLLHRSMASLEWLRVGDRIALELTPARTLRILLNSEDMGVQYANIPNDVYVVAELQGSTVSVQVISSQGPSSPLRPCSLRLQDSLDFGVDPLNKQDSMLESIDSEAQNYEFGEFCGKNVSLLEDQRSAMRTESYGCGIVFITKPLSKGDSISVRVDKVNTKWTGTIGLGVVAALPQVATMPELPKTLLHLKRGCWVVTSDFMNINGQQLPSKYAECLEQIVEGTVITLTLTHAGTLTVMVNSTNLDDLASGLPNNVYPVFDIYGICEKISIITGPDPARSGTPILEEQEAEDIPIDAVVATAVAPAPLEPETIVPQCEKADLEVHEKETDGAAGITLHQAELIAAAAVAGTSSSAAGGASSTSNPMNRSVMESVSENLFWNMSVKILVSEQNRSETPSTSCCQLESLQLQHNTNLNIQRSQSTQRFQNSLNTPTSAGAAAVAALSGVAPSGSSISLPSTTSTASCIRDTNKDIDEETCSAVLLQQAAYNSSLGQRGTGAGAVVAATITGIIGGNHAALPYTETRSLCRYLEAAEILASADGPAAHAHACNTYLGQNQNENNNQNENENIFYDRAPNVQAPPLPLASYAANNSSDNSSEGEQLNNVRTLLDIINDYNQMYGTQSAHNADSGAATAQSSQNDASIDEVEDEEDVEDDAATEDDIVPLIRPDNEQNNRNDNALVQQDVEQSNAEDDGRRIYDEVPDDRRIYDEVPDDRRIYDEVADDRHIYDEVDDEDDEDVDDNDNDNDDEDDDDVDEDADNDDDDDDNIQEAMDSRLMLLQQLQIQNDYLRNHHAAAAANAGACGGAESSNGDSENNAEPGEAATGAPSTTSSTALAIQYMQQEALVQFDVMSLLNSLEQHECDYFKLVEQFSNTFVLPQSFFDHDAERLCFCSQCHAQALEKLRGWAYFKLDQQAVNATAAACNAKLDTGEWVPLYYMTRADKVRATLDYGQPMPLEPNSETLSLNSSQKDEPGTRLELHYSPNACSSLPFNVNYHYRSMGQRYRIGTAFEVYVRRQSLCTSAASSSSSKAPSSYSTDALPGVSEDEFLDGASCFSAPMGSSIEFPPPGPPSSSGGDSLSVGSFNSAPLLSGGTLSGASGIIEAEPPASLSGESIAYSSEACYTNSSNVTSNYGLKTMSWFTKEAGACVITALVLKLEKCN